MHACADYIITVTEVFADNISDSRGYTPRSEENISTLLGFLDVS